MPIPALVGSAVHCGRADPAAKRAFKDSLFELSLGADGPESEARARAPFGSLKKLASLASRRLVLPGHTSEPVSSDGVPLTAPIGDVASRLIVWGIITQAAALVVIGFGLATPFAAGLAGSVLLGIGTAMVYPLCSRPVGDGSHPARATSVGIYRFRVMRLDLCWPGS